MTDPKTPSPAPGETAPDVPEATDEATAPGGPETPVETDVGAPPDGETESPAAPPGRRLRHIAIAVGALLALLAVGYISWPLWQGGLPAWLHAGLAPVMEAGRGGGAGAGVAALERRLDRTEAALGALQKEVAALPRPDPTIASRVTALENTIAELKADVVEKAGGTELARLAARVEALEKRPAAPATGGGSETASAIEALRAQSAQRMTRLERENDALRATIADLNRRIGALGAKASAAKAGAEAANALLLAVGQLREATRGTAGFAAALDAVRALARGDAGIEKPAERLAPHAGQGVADLTTLRARFGPVADAIVRAASAPKGGGWLDRTIARISSLVTVRRVGERAAASNDAQGLVARAELRLAAGDLAGAVAALAKLDGAPARAASGWLADARKRLAVDRAVAELFAHALEGVSAERRG